MLKLNKKQLKNLWQENQTVILVVLTALLLAVILLTVRAAGPLVSYEPETGSLGGNALIKSDSSVSGGKYVEFTANTPLPPEPPTPSSDYGAGAPGSSLSVPAGAVNVNPSNIVSEINSRPGGTKFRLSDGTYKLGQLPNKAGNEYYGNPSDHSKVVFDGEATYSSLTQPNPDRAGSHATGGKYYVWNLMNNNVIANMTMRRYRGEGDEKGYGPLAARGTSANNVLIQNVELRDNQFSGIRLGTSRWKVRFLTSRHNGQYGMSGSGTDHIVENTLLYANGNDGLTYVPRYERSDRGAFKFVHMTDQIVRNTEVHSHQDNGMWWDGTTKGMLVENNYIHDNRRHGIIFELSLGGTIRNNNLVNNAQSSPAQDYRDSNIFSNVGGPILIEGNTVTGGRNGIVLYQPNRSFTLGTTATPICGSVIRNNTIKGNIKNAWIGIHSPATYGGCNPEDNPSSVTIQNNNEQGSGVKYWFGGSYSASQWASKGYN